MAIFRVVAKLEWIEQMGFYFINVIVNQTMKKLEVVDFIKSQF
jgi:hypothetical protein